MEDQSLQALLEQFEEAFERSIAIERSEDVKQKQQLRPGAILSLMSCVYSLGQAIVLQKIDPEIPELKQLLKQTLIQLPVLSYGVNFYIGKTIDRLERSKDPWTEYELWKEVCFRRSAIAFFLTLYPEVKIVLNEHGEEYLLDTSLLDELMEEEALREGPVNAADVPSGLPASHWWWWSPKSPPAEGTA